MKPVDLLLLAAASLVAVAVGIASVTVGLLVGAALAVGLWWLLDDEAKP